MHVIWSLITLTFCITTAVAFLFTLLTHFILWLEIRKLTLASNNTHAHTVMPNSWCKLLKSFFIEFGCTVLNILLYPIRFISKDQKQIRNRYSPSAIPVLFVHGYLHNQMAWFWFTRYLRQKTEIGPLYSVNLFPPFASIITLAKQLKNKINDIKIETNASQVILIGHSMGGIVCSYFCEYLAKPNEVAMIITLGSPFKGTRIAKLGFGQNAKEMRPNSSFLTELGERIQNSKIPYHSIASKIDNMIIPWQSALLSDEPPIRKQFILEDHGHLRLLTSLLIINKVAEWISTRHYK